MKKTLDIKKLILLNMPYILLGLFATNFGEAWRMAQGADASEKFLSLVAVLPGTLQSFWPSLHPLDLLVGLCCGVGLRLAVYLKSKNAKKYRTWYGIWFCPLECIILSVNDTYMDAQEVMHMTDYSKITALYSRLSVGDEDRDGGESNSIQNQKIFLENYARGQHLTNIRHYIDDDESGRFFDRSAYSRMMDDVENGKIGVCIMKDLTRWGRDYLQVGNAMEIFRRNNVRFIAVNNGIDSEKPDTLEFAPFINIMSEWYAKDISKKVKTGIKTKGMSGKPIVTEAPYGYIKDPDNKDFWIIDEEAAEVVRLIFRLFIGGKNRNQIAVHLKNEQIPTPTFYMKDRGRGTCKNKTLNEDNRCKWNKATLTNILTRQEYCGDVVNFKTTKHFRDKHNHYVDRSQWHITENVHEPIISRSDFETVQRILENAPVRRPNGDGEIHPLSGLLFCKDCGAKMHIRIDYRNGGKRHVAYCSEYHKGKAKNPKCHSPHIMDADLLMQTIAEVLKKIEDYSISNRAEFEALVKKNLAMQQTDQTKKQQKRIPQITTRLEQIDKVLNKLYEDNALGTIPQDRYEQMSQKYSEEYYALKAELATLQEQLSAYENAGGRAQKFLKLTERHAAFTDLTPAILNEFISRIEVHERDQKRARYAIQHISIYFNYIGKFENEVTQLAEPTEQEIRQMREEIEEAKKEKSRAYHRQYSREYRARNLERQREYDRMKAREYRAKEKGAGSRRTAHTVKQNNRQPRGIFRTTGNPSFAPKERSRLWQNRPPTVSSRPRGTGRPLLRSYFSITAAQKHSATSCSNWCLPTATRLSASDGQEPEKTEILR